MLAVTVGGNRVVVESRFEHMDAAAVLQGAGRARQPRCRQGCRVDPAAATARPRKPNRRRDSPHIRPGPTVLADLDLEVIS